MQYRRTIRPRLSLSNSPEHVVAAGGAANSYRTGLVGIAHVKILRDPVPTRPLQPAKRAHNCGRGRVVAVTPLAKTSYAIGMAYRCVCMLENTHVMRTHTNTRIGNCQIFFLIFKRVSPTTTVNKRDCCLL